jgi:hypothetical protein
MKLPAPVMNSLIGYLLVRRSMGQRIADVSASRLPVDMDFNSRSTCDFTKLGRHAPHRKHLLMEPKASSETR